MRKIFQQELSELGDDLAAMAEKVAEAVRGAGEALREVDIEKAEKVIDADNRIDEYEDTIEAMCLSLLALQQPVATDLRLVVSAMRLSATLERMGDLARHVAYMVRSRYPEAVSSGPMLELISGMTIKASEVTNQFVELMDTHDLDAAHAIHVEDDYLDDALTRSFDLLTVQNVELTRQEVVDAVLLIRFLERIGDHCVSGADRIMYLVTGDLDRSVTAPVDGEEMYVD
ncbi:MAG TPA: phosphate signaling complex protein PhoU [Actinomycetaceae bacterium]|nr:phosphate signaling complex protein PhoU [Actinomycetaceae bacterium]